jgi:hypothetical protein
MRRPTAQTAAIAGGYREHLQRLAGGAKAGFKYVNQPNGALPFPQPI